MRNESRLFGGANLRYLWRSRLALLGLTALIALGTPSQAQFGLAEQGAVLDAQSELAGNRSGKGAPSEEEQDAEQPQPEASKPSSSPRPARNKDFTDQWNDAHSIYRLESPSISWWKLLLVLLVFFAWVRSCDWVNRDAQLYRLGYETWNPAMVIPFTVAFMLPIFLPNFIVAIAVMTVAWLVPFFAYVLHHNNSVEEHQTVFTGQWFRYQGAELGKLFGLKIASEKQADYLRGPQIDLQAQGGDERTDQANLLTARQSPGYVLVKELVVEMIDRGSSRVLMDYTSSSVGVRHMIDGVWHNGEARDRDSGDVMLAVIKQLANLNVSERKRKQEGKFIAEREKKKFVCEIASQGVKTGERAVISLRDGSRKQEYQTLTELGMRDKLREQWLEIMDSETGVIVYAAMPEGGLTTLTDVGLTETDRLLRDFMAVEEVTDPQTEIENVPPHYYDSAKGESPASIIPSLSRKYPNVWVIRDFVDAESAKLMMDEVDLERLVITTVHAKEAPEACLRLLKKKVPHKEFANGLLGVLCTRLIRTLCSDCKVEYEATPAMLKKLGIPPGKVTKFYQPPKPEEVNKPCLSCAGIGYRGRTGLFELLVVDDQFRQTLAKQPKPEALRAAAKAAGMRTFQEEGVLLVAKGVTSLTELSRVLKG